MLYLLTALDAVLNDATPPNENNYKICTQEIQRMRGSREVCYLPAMVSAVA